MFSMQKIQEPATTDFQKKKRVRFTNWLFLVEKMFELEGMYNTQNDRMWAINRQEADKKGGVKKKHQYLTKVMVWLGACRERLTLLIILDKGTLTLYKKSSSG